MGIRSQYADYFNFTGGLNTEASPLKISPTDLTVANNININVDGSIHRRRGVSFIKPEAATSATTSTVDCTTVNGTPQESAINAFYWSTLTAQNTRRNNVVMSVGNSLRIYPATLSELGDVDTYQTLSIKDYATKEPMLANTTFTQDGTRLLVMNPNSKPSYLNITGSTATRTTFNIIHRLFVENFVSTAFAEFKALVIKFVTLGYITYQYTGKQLTEFDSSVITTTELQDEFDTLVAKYSIVKATSATFSTPVTDNSTLASIIAHIFSDGNGITTYSLADKETLSEFIPVCAEVFQRRLFVVGGTSGEKNKLWFSQTVDTADDYGKMYQEADPYDFTDPNIVATDGGSVVLTGVDEVLTLHATPTSLIIIATNGVWEVVGDNGIFKATDYTIKKISDYGGISKNGSVIVENNIVYLADTTINVIARQDAYATASTVSSISDEKIKTLYANIPALNKKTGYIFYDSIENKLYCYFDFNGKSTVNNTNLIKTGARQALIFDIRLKAWYTWELATGDYRFHSTFKIPTSSTEVVSVIDTSLNEVITTTGDFISNGVVYTVSNTDRVCCILSKYDVALNKVTYGFAKLHGDSLVDFAYVDDAENFFVSTISSAHQSFEDMSRTKQVNYAYFVVERTEDGTKNIHDKYNYPANAELRTSWDFANTTLTITDTFGQEYYMNVPNGKAVNLYREYRPVASILGNADAGASHAIYKHKLLGRGKILQYNITSTQSMYSFKCIAPTSQSPFTDTDSWEQIEFNGSLPTFTTTTNYTYDDEVKLVFDNDFKVVGWTSEILVNE